ncbi:MAG TPA: hypothetical protein PKV78_04715 [Methanoculleus thermophilus]|nr:hypothetical protein [Methanoculleus thermophilus]
MSCIMSDELKTLSRRISEVENNYSRALALLEDRLHKVETQELNEVDERLCRLESPPVWEIDPRATAKPSKTPAAVTIPIRVFECCAPCGAPMPCTISVDRPSVRPDHCPYTGRRVKWQVAEVPK